MSITKLSPNWACQMGPIHCPKFLLTGVYYEMYICTPHTTSSGYISLLDSSLFASYIEMTYVHICNMCNTVWILHHSSQQYHLCHAYSSVFLFPQNFVKQL